MRPSVLHSYPSGSHPREDFQPSEATLVCAPWCQIFSCVQISSSPPVVPNLCESGKAWKSGRMSSPSDIFFYIFLPPLLLDSAVRIDFYVFRKVQVYQAMRWFEPALLTNKQASSSPPLLDVKCLSRGWRGPGRRRFGGGLNHVTVPDLCVRPCRAEHLSVDPHHVSVIGGHGLILQPLAAGILRP
eukprot:scaffold9695_cov31-Tisochrysis_lutea.AAC.2